MSKTYKIYLWKKATFLRLLLPVIAGILLEFYFPIPLKSIAIAGAILALFYFLFTILPLAYRFKYHPLAGIIISLFLVNAGAFVTWQKDIRNHNDWYGNRYDESSYVIATINEPPIEKNKSYKALATVDAVVTNGKSYKTAGKILLYFSKDSSLTNINYGSRIIIKKDLQEIKNSGNPAAFNYAQYCAFQQIFHQCYLKKNDWMLLNGSNTNVYKKTIFATREFVINQLNQYISGSDESSLAKALLIGYKVDLDKDLVQAYSNAGVVHLIAISGLHLALIYALLLWITARIPFINKSKYVRLVVILFCLWFFSFLTGASASVLRSAVMFSFIAAGMTFNKKASVYNSLASSAFVLLCIDPFLLWNVGFQLSYCAVLGIVTAQRYIYNWFYFQNKLLRGVWQIASVSLAAQLFTLPLCLYYFHQLPLLFLLSNVIAIPLATLILWSCIGLIAISPIHIAAIYLGKIITSIIWCLNHSVLYINALPFSLWDGISITIVETILLYIIIASFLYWLIKKNVPALKFALIVTFIFAGSMGFQKWNFSSQKKIIVYNVPAHKAVDFISGNDYQFMGDRELQQNGLLQNFHLKPSRVSLHLARGNDSLTALNHYNNFYQFYQKRIVMIDSAVAYQPSEQKINVDYIFISKNPKLYLPNLAAAFNCGMYVFDASNPMWKIDKWKKDCEQLHLRFHSVPEQGAFIIDF
ncbi:MAG: ComEC/Rec2 family competence protein [Ginsengibacter sp.]